eukprot:g101.t1
MSKTKRRSLPVDCQFARLQSQWENGRNGNGAWFWQHFKPVLCKDSAGNPTELHLQCEHCSKLFSARNPSRTSLEHLRSGACSVFRGTAAFEAVKASPRNPNQSKRIRKFIKTESVTNELLIRKLHNGVNDASDVLSTGNNASFNRTVIEETLMRFFLEAYDAVPLNCIDHPRILELCSLLGVQPIQPQSLLTSCLDRRYQEMQEETSSRLRKSGLYQGSVQLGTDGVLDLLVSPSEGNPVFLKRIEFPLENLDPNLIMEVMSSATDELDSILDRRCCLGWIANVTAATRFGLELMEVSHPWMANLPCQISALRKLMKDFIKHIPIIKETMKIVRRVVNFASENPQIVTKMESMDLSPLNWEVGYLEAVFTHRVKLEQSALLHRHSEISSEGIEVLSAILDQNFWSCIEESRALFQPIMESIQFMEQTQPHLSQVLDMWMNLDTFLQQWTGRDPDAYSNTLPLFKKRFGKSYHPIMAASYFLDPAFCVKQNTGLLMPNWNRLSDEQQENVCFMMKKISPSNRYHRVLSDFSHWQTRGLPEEFQSIVSHQITTPLSCSGIGLFSKVVPMALRKAAWVSCLKDLEALGAIAQKVLSMRGSIRTLEDTRIHPNSRSATLVDSKLLYVSYNARLAANRVHDEKKMDIELIQSVTEAQKEKKMKTEDNFEFPNREEGQLYMQQLNIESIEGLDMTPPPPLGTMPELQLNPSEEKNPAANQAQDLVLDENNEQDVHTSGNTNQAFGDN